MTSAATRSAPQLIDRVAQADARGAAQELGHNSRAVARGGARVTAAVSISTTKMWYLNPIQNGTTNLTI